QSQHDGQSGRERGIGGPGSLRTLVAVPPALHELEIVVAEAPEERFGPLQYARVVVRLEGFGRLGHERRKAAQQRTIDRPRDWTLRLGGVQRELRRVEHLHRQTAS